MQHPPAIIAFHHSSAKTATNQDVTPIILVFQSKVIGPVHGEEDLERGWYLPKACPDDGVLFLEGAPQDYMAQPIYVDWYGEEELRPWLDPGVVQIMRDADEGLFGEVSVDGVGAGFRYHNGDHTFEHDARLGVMVGSGPEQGSGNETREIVVVIGCAGEKVRRYYDEIVEPSAPNLEVRKGQADRSVGFDVDSEIKEAMEGLELEDGADREGGDEDELAGCMRTMRLES